MRKSDGIKKIKERIGWGWLKRALWLVYLIKIKCLYCKEFFRIIIKSDPIGQP